MANKSKWVIVLAAALALGNLTGLSASSTTQVAIVKVQVESVFELSLDRTDVDFAAMKPGTIKYDIPATGIRVITKSNTGRKWMLKVNTVSELRSGDNTIDNQNFSWYGWTEGRGKWYGTGSDTLTLTPATAYESSDSEGLNLPWGTSNVFKFRLNVPQTQKAGNYETVVRFTLTE